MRYDPRDDISVSEWSTIGIPYWNHSEAYNWCFNNVKFSEWRHGYGTPGSPFIPYYFVKEEDAIMCKLKFNV